MIDDQLSEVQHEEFDLNTASKQQTEINQDLEGGNADCQQEILQLALHIRLKKKSFKRVSKISLQS